MLKNANRLLLISSLLGLSACVSTDMSDLEMQVSEIMNRPGGRIEPLPPITPYEEYSYQSSQNDAVDPFEPFYKEAAPQIKEGAPVDNGLTEEMVKEIEYRNREELEGYELDSLRMVGTLEDDDIQWGIVLDPNGTVHQVKVGNYIGKNIGKITNIFEERIQLREIVQNSQGRWEEREAALALAE